MADETEVKTNFLVKKFPLELPVVAGAITIGVCIVLTVGLVSGFVGRPAQCKPVTTTSTILPPITTSPSTSPTTSNTATTGSSSSSASTGSSATSASTGSSATSASTGSSATSASTGSSATSASTGSTSRPTSQITTTTIIPTTTSLSSTSGSTSPLQTVTRTLPTTVTASTPSTRTTPAPVQFLLPKFVTPSKYDLLLRFDFNPYANAAEGTNLNYTGEVTISTQVTEQTDLIMLHMDRNVQLTDTNIVITNSANGQTVQVASSAYMQNQLYRINLQSLIAPGAYTILLKFSSQTSREGLYFHSFEDRFRMKSLIASRFIPIQARTAFPCFDEPGFKATFSLTIEHPSDSMALSNFPVLTKTDIGQNKTRTVFKETYPMSTYTLGIAVVPDDFTSKKLPAIPNIPVEISIYGRKPEIDNLFGDFALDLAGKLVSYFVDYTGLKEALPPKLDLIGLPFYPEMASASWGLNGFHEEELFYNKDINSQTDLQTIAFIVAKEIAHNWFGNYITCKYWDDLWLNEGFASHFAFKALNDIFQEWDMENQFITEHTVPILWRDAFQNELPLKYEVDSNTDIKFLFDEITASKSPALIRMIEASISPAAFKQDVITYLSAHPYAVATSEYFYSVFRSPDASLTTKNWIEPWLIQNSFPLITIVPSTSGANTIIDFSQARFQLTKLNFGPPKDYFWPIFLQCKAGGNADSPIGGSILNFDYLLNAKTGSKQLTGVYNWIKCNNDFKGYYLNNYTNSQFETFETVIVETYDRTFSIGDRANLIHNSFELAFLGAKSYQIPAYLDNFMNQIEENFIPWRTFIYHIQRLATITEHRPSFVNTRAYGIRMIKGAIERLGFDIWADSASHNEEVLKMLFAETLCRLHDAACLLKCTELFETISPVYFISPFEPNKNPLSTNIREIVYKYHLQNAYDPNEWYRLYDFYPVVQELRERELAADAFGYSRLNWILDYLLRDTIARDTRIKLEDIYRILSNAGKNPTGRYYTWYFIREYWGDLFLAGADMRKVHLALRDMVESFQDPLLIEELFFFYTITYDFENSDLRSQMFEQTFINLEWVLEIEQDYTSFFFEFPRTLEDIKKKHGY